tara:strand:+ start:4332 stop:4520 length:189 start_codon:yes stop_codon:yes gene_type:complete
MVRLEQVAALILAAGLAIPSYWFFWTLAGGGGYEKRKIEPSSLGEKAPQIKQDKNTKVLPLP